ncbi:hypothetical protein DC522_03575 [Microvirga sp. KLBC 81]|uniref:hypothetical protein n=1 Tax=Microvirga sp. KLBC 81 TaxID=1862707 RepID=UPI000D509D69|nr:hypothetical protein [Microvirga sp. KLBC 81]PVE25861.1 hypothetical protein DC522_03575 [Microvirga sp. KLBC 81]
MLERTEFFAVLLAAVVALVIVAFAVVAGASAPLQAEGQAVQEPTCSEWTDGCIVCARTPQGLACSTPGIACVRQAPRCLKP